MIIGRYSALKGFSLLALVAVAAFLIIFAQNRVVARINSIIIAAEIGWLIYVLWNMWSDKTTKNK